MKTTRPGKRLARKKPVGFAAAAIAGARAAIYLAFFTAAAYGLLLVWNTINARAGGPHGWEIVAPATIGAAFYLGWAFCADQARQKSRKRREEKRQREQLLRGSQDRSLYFPGPRAD